MRALCANMKCIEREAVSMREAAEWKARAHETRAELAKAEQRIAELEADRDVWKKEAEAPD